MKKSGYWSGPGVGVGTFTDTTAAARAYLRDHGDQVAFVDLYEITLLTLGTVTTATGRTAGLVLRHAATDIDIVFEGKLYAGGGLANGWKLARKALTTEIGTAVDELAITIMLDGTERLPPADGNPATPQFGLAEAVHSGILEGAHVLYRRVLLPNLPTYPYVPSALSITLGATTLFAGQVTGDSDIARSVITLKVKSYLERLSMSMPRNIYQAGCLNTLYDTMCGVSRTATIAGKALQVLGTVSTFTPATNVVTLTATPSQPDDVAGAALSPRQLGFFTLGSLQFTSGVLCGMKQMVVAHVGAGMTLMLTPPRPPAPGDTCVLQAGCDKVAFTKDTGTGIISDSTCNTKFANLLNFRGFPHIPTPSTAV